MPNKKLNDIENNALIGFMKLETLNLKNNKITSLKSNMFNQDLKMLSLLDLSSNQIELIEKDTFKYLTKLVTLHLNKNKIQQLDSYLFQGLINLNALYLSSNKIKEIKSNTFSQLPNLKYLLLNINKIQLIQANALTGSCNLQKFDITDNPATDLYLDYFKLGEC